MRMRRVTFSRGDMLMRHGFFERLGYCGTNALTREMVLWRIMSM